MTKKILITTGGLSSVGQTGGISSYTHDLASSLQNAGHEVMVYLIKENNTVYPVNVNYQWTLYNIPETYAGEEEVIRKLLQDIEFLNPDVIINNDTSYIAGLWPVFKTEIIKISVMHGFSKHRTLTNVGIVGKMAIVNHEFVDFIVCQNSRMVTDSAKKYNLPPEKVIFIPQTFKDPGAVGEFTNPHLRIMFANGLNENKGAKVALEIKELLINSEIEFTFNWCMLPDDHKLQLDQRFETFGGLARTDFLAQLQASDIILIPTKLDTGPMLVVEALGNSAVPLCNNLEESAIPDLITDGENGFIVKGNDPKIYFEIIKRLYNDRRLLQRIKENGRKFYMSNLTENHQVANYHKIFVKNSHRPSTKLRKRNIIYYHLKKTSHLPLWSLGRIFLKLRYTFEIPLCK